MGAFEDCRKIEARGMEDITRFFGEHAHNGRFVLNEKGRLSRVLQETFGDAFVTSHNGGVLAVECKCEVKKRPNFFLESWSNKAKANRGWLFKIDADVLLYYFIESADLYLINFRELKDWALDPRKGNLRDHSQENGDGRRRRFYEAAQGKYGQQNDTWGFLVPIRTIELEVGLKHFCLRKYHDPSFKEQGSLFGG